MKFNNMLIEVDSISYKKHFPVDPNPFISGTFIELNISKTEKVIRLINDKDKADIGLTAGIMNGILKSPFSAPFGGFHFRNNNIYISEIEVFLNSLKQYIISQQLNGVDITLPPDIYHETINAKLINSLIRMGFQSSIPEITNWVNLNQFKEEFTQKNSREYYRQALRNELSFNITDDSNDKMKVYDLIRQNRAKFGRPIYMSFDDIIKTSQLWPVDFFKVTTPDGSIVASAIFYRCHPSICYAVFWGDSEAGRPLRAMDFLAFQLWSHYKKSGYSYIDLGISTEKGNPNEGLLRFKESHDATSSLRYNFSWHK
jgi:hypothetical protein